jgi:hypothetical protein
MDHRDVTDRVLVTGDWRGDATWAVRTIRAAAHAGIRTIMVVGDMNILWPGSNGTFEDAINSFCSNTGVTVYFVDGNHDNHEALNARAEKRPGEFILIRDRLHWAPRGLRWQWAGRQFGALGGAHSPNGRYLIEGTTWWPTLERPTQTDLARLGDDPLDILITHDAPQGTTLAGITITDEDQALTNEVQALIRQAVDATRPTVHFHGHWHQRATHTITHLDGSTTTVESLNKVNTPQNAVVLTLADLSVTNFTSRY